ncbi:MAG: nicotinic acid mononucleotide adenyltransferase [Flavobacteriaceae bacterium]|nr:nicotinic acid mononucleotide adenyltransferase [Flavobacteriaceae bacterium]
MKKIAALVLLLTVSICSAQEVAPKFEKSADLVKATYYYQDGTIKEQGFFKDKKLTGKWVRYNKEGEKTMIAYYKAGKKVGKWFAWNKNTLKEINYANNTIVSVKNWNQAETKLASNKK